MESFIQALAGLLPFQTYILTAVALFILIGIAGGGKIVVKDLVVGELKFGARCTSMLTGFVLAVIVLLIPKPLPSEPPAEPEHVSIRGWVLNDEKLGTGNTEDNLYKVMLVNNPRVVEVQSNDRSFTFSKTEGLSKGNYTVILFKGNQPISSFVANLESTEQDMVISKYNGGTYHLKTPGSAVAYWVQRYGNPETNWKERLTIIEQLVDLRANEDMKNDVIETMTNYLSFDKKSSEYQLALFTLGQMKREEAHEGLGELMNDSGMKIYSRIRAAWLLNDYLGDETGHNFLMGLIKDGSEKPYVRTVAARYLTRINNSNQICVIERLVGGLHSVDKDIKALSHEILQRISREHFASDPARWGQWFESKRANFDAC